MLFAVPPQRRVDVVKLLSEVHPLRYSADQPDARGGRLQRLATRISQLAEKDERYLRHSREVAALRISAAAEVHAICRAFVDSVNHLLDRSELVLDPPEFSAAQFHEDAANLLQISVRGRILQVEFAATGELLSTEDFRVPYTLSGAVRAFNQQLLEKDLIEEHLLFYTVEKQGNMWRFFDARTYHTGAFDRDYLISLMEQLI
jgi:hypothetical protein